MDGCERVVFKCDAMLRNAPRLMIAGARLVLAHPRKIRSSWKERIDFDILAAAPNDEFYVWVRTRRTRGVIFIRVVNPAAVHRHDNVRDPKPCFVGARTVSG